MKHISIIIPKGNTVLSSVVGPYKLFSAVNSYLIQQGQASGPSYQVDLVGVETDYKLYDGAFSINATATIDVISKTDLVIIPAFFGDIPAHMEMNKDYISWIVDMRAKGAEVASLCMGAFLLGATGLVDGKKCTTHWMGADGFRMMFPKVDLVPENVIVDEGGIYSSGGAYSFLNLVLHLIEKYSGREVAIYLSKLFEIEIDRYSQSNFTIFSGQKTHEDEPIKKAQEYIESNYQAKISIEKLSEMFAISQRNFIRRFKKATNNTPTEYIQRVKIEVAKKSLESSSENVNEIMWSVGYTDSKSFRSVFKKYTGISPNDYKNKYNRQLTMV